MTSRGGDVAERELLCLIYLHLKQNGYQEVADVLKQHVNQKETQVRTTLQEIYTTWVNRAKQVPEVEETPVKKAKLFEFARKDPGDWSRFPTMLGPGEPEVTENEDTVKFAVVGNITASSESETSDDLGEEVGTLPQQVVSCEPSMSSETEKSEEDSEDDDGEEHGTAQESVRSSGGTLVTPSQTSTSQEEAGRRSTAAESSRSGRDSGSDQETPLWNPGETSEDPTPALQTASKEASASRMKPCHSTHVVAKATPRSLAGEKMESSVLEASHDSGSDEPLPQNTVATPESKLVSPVPSGAGVVIAPAVAKARTTPDNAAPSDTLAISKPSAAPGVTGMGQTSDGDHQHAEKVDDAPVQKASVVFPVKQLAAEDPVQPTSTPKTPGPVENDRTGIRKDESAEKMTASASIGGPSSGAIILSSAAPQTVVIVSEVEEMPDPSRSKREASTKPNFETAASKVLTKRRSKAKTQDLRSPEEADGGPDSSQSKTRHLRGPCNDKRRHAKEEEEETCLSEDLTAVCSLDPVLTSAWPNAVTGNLKEDRGAARAVAPRAPLDPGDTLEKFGEGKKEKRARRALIRLEEEEEEEEEESRAATHPSSPGPSQDSGSSVGVCMDLDKLMSKALIFILCSATEATPIVKDISVKISTSKPPQPCEEAPPAGRAMNSPPGKAKRKRCMDEMDASGKSSKKKRAPQSEIEPEGPGQEAGREGSRGLDKQKEAPLIFSGGDTPEEHAVAATTILSGKCLKKKRKKSNRSRAPKSGPKTATLKRKNKRSKDRWAKPGKWQTSIGSRQFRRFNALQQEKQRNKIKMKAKKGKRMQAIRHQFPSGIWVDTFTERVQSKPQYGDASKASKKRGKR